MSDMFVEMECPQCGAKISATALECSFCNRKLRDVETRFLYKKHQVKTDWLDVCLPYLAVAWGACAGYSGAIVQDYGGIVMIVLSAISLVVLFRVEVLYTTCKFLLALVAVRTTAILMMFGREFSIWMNLLFGALLVLSLLFGIAIHHADD